MQRLLAYISSDVTNDEMIALEDLAEMLARSGQWSVAAPQYVNETDESSLSRGADEAVRTTGIMLMVRSPGEPEKTPVEEPRRVLEALAVFSLERGVEFEVLLDDTFVGEVQAGKLDRLLTEGLLEPWEGES